MPLRPDAESDFDGLMNIYICSFFLCPYHHMLQFYTPLCQQEPFYGISCADGVSILAHTSITNIFSSTAVLQRKLLEVTESRGSHWKP